MQPRSPISTDTRIGVCAVEGSPKTLHLRKPIADGFAHTFIFGRTEPRVEGILGIRVPRRPQSLNTTCLVVKPSLPIVCALLLRIDTGGFLLLALVLTFYTLGFVSLDLVEISYCLVTLLFRSFLRRLGCFLCLESPFIGFGCRRYGLVYLVRGVLVADGSLLCSVHDAEKHTAKVLLVFLGQVGIVELNLTPLFLGQVGGIELYVANLHEGSPLGIVLGGVFPHDSPVLLAEYGRVSSCLDTCVDG